MSEPVANVACPWGCGNTIHLMSGHLICVNERCPERLGLQKILEQNRPYHLVELEATTFSIQHPLSERLNGELFRCPVHAQISGAPRPPKPGTFKVSPDPLHDGYFYWEPA